MPDLDQLVAELARSLTRFGVAHAFGGALALSYWAPPRATADIDVNVFVAADRLTAAYEAIEAAGFAVDRAASGRSAEDRGDFRAWCGPVRLDVFVSFAPFHDEVARRAAKVPHATGETIRVLTAEDLTLFKTLFNRPKDWLDIEKIIAQQGERLDLDYLRHWLAEWIATDDPRWERLEATLRSGR